jgi:hypothetical protein
MPSPLRLPAPVLTLTHTATLATSLAPTVHLV